MIVVSDLGVECCAVSVPETGEQALVRAVLLRAILDLVDRRSRHASEPYRDAIVWVQDRSVRAWGFAWCCEVLGVSPTWLRRLASERGWLDWEFEGDPETASRLMAAWVCVGKTPKKASKKPLTRISCLGGGVY